jgi:agmatine deiminase
MMTRRQFHTTLTATLAATATGLVTAKAASGWHMPDEGEPHLRTWMAFAGAADIWGELLPHVQRDLARVANTIVRFEPVHLLVNPSDVARARKLVDPRVVLVECPLDDLWVRDSGCVFVKNTAGERAGVDFNFNGWGDKQAHDRDAAVAAFMTERADVAHLRSRLVLEGGGIEVDGAGTAIITESCVLNANRNPGLGKAAVESALKEALGLQKILWLPGIAGQDITDGHTDFYARFVRPGVVVAALDNDPQSFDHPVTRRHLDILRQSTDAAGRRLEVHVLAAPANPRNSHRSRDFAAGYINFYVCNGAVIAPEFGDRAADEAAHGTLARLFPGRPVVPVAIDAIAAGGGGIHCATQQEPR